MINRILNYWIKKFSLRRIRLIINIIKFYKNLKLGMPKLKTILEYIKWREYHDYEDKANYGLRNLGAVRGSNEKS